jgi:trehalose 6-phosphate phosphatase
VPLPTPATASGRAGLAAIRKDPRRAMLAFDYDGVLAPIVDNPNHAFPQPGAVVALGRLAHLVGSVVVISGRPADVVVKLGGFADAPDLRGLVVFGHYGRERWDASTGEILAPPTPAGIEALRHELPEVIRTYAPPQAWLEDKGVALAVHTRTCPDPAAALAALRSPIADCAERHGLVVEPGRYVLEVRPPGVDKGHALREYALERHAASVAYTGDDLGDLSAFAAVEGLRALGVQGLKVGSGSTEVVEVAQRADLVVDGPSGVVDFVEGLIEALSHAGDSIDRG